MSFQIKELDNSEINEVVSLHNFNYGDKRTPKQWIWEYKSIYPDLFVFTVIKDKDRVVGTQGMIPVYLHIKAKTYLTGKSENSLLDPKYRGRTLFKKLYAFAMSICKLKKMCYIWGFTSATKVWRNKLGFSVYEDIMYTSILILNPRQFISSIRKSKQVIIKKITKSFLVILLYLYSSVRRFIMDARRYFKSSPGKYLIEHKLRSINDIDKLYKRLRSKYADLIHIEQDENYINWRILKNPNIKYIIYFIYEENILKGYCYIALGTKNEAHLSDLTFENNDVGNFLLKTILDQLHGKKITIIDFMGNIENPLIATTFNLLKKHGFIKRGQFSPFVLKNISYKNEEQLENIKNWYLNGLWTEGYQI